MKILMNEEEYHILPDLCSVKMLCLLFYRIFVENEEVVFTTSRSYNLVTKSKLRELWQDSTQILLAIYVYKIQAICCNLIPKTIMTKYNRFEKN